MIQRVVDLLVPFGFCVLLTEGHRTEPDDAHVEIGATELAVLHETGILP